MIVALSRAQAEWQAAHELWLGLQPADPTADYAACLDLLEATHNRLTRAKEVQARYGCPASSRPVSALASTHARSSRF